MSVLPSHSWLKSAPSLFIHPPVGGQEECLYLAIIMNNPAWTFVLGALVHTRSSRAHSRYETAEFLRMPVTSFSLMQELVTGAVVLASPDPR